MATPSLPIAGFPHLSLSSQDNERLYAKTLATLRNAGFTIDGEMLIPPEGADSRFVISTITAAFQEAKAG